MSSNEHIRNGYNQSRYYKDDIGAGKRNRKFQSHHTHHNTHHNSYSNHSSYQQQQQQQPTPQPYLHQSSINPFSSRRQESNPTAKIPSTNINNINNVNNTNNNSTNALPNNSLSSSSSASQPLPSQADQFQQHYRSNDNAIPSRNGPPNVLGAKQRRSNFRSIPRPGPSNSGAVSGNLSRNSSSSGLPSQSSYYRSYGPGTNNNQQRYADYSDYPPEEPYADPIQMQQIYGHPPPPKRLSNYTSKADRYGNTGGDLINSTNTSNMPPQMLNDKRYSNRKSYNDNRFGPNSRQGSQGGNAYSNRGGFRDDYRNDDDYYRAGSAGQYTDRHYQGYGGRYPVEFKREYQTSSSSSSSLIHSVHPKPKTGSLSPTNETKKSSAASSMAPSIRNDDDIEEDLFPEKTVSQRVTPDISTTSTTPTSAIAKSSIIAVKKEEPDSKENESVYTSAVDRTRDERNKDEEACEQIKSTHIAQNKSVELLKGDSEESEKPEVLMRDASPFIQASSSEESYSPTIDDILSPEQPKKVVDIEPVKEEGEPKKIDVEKEEKPNPEVKEDLKISSEEKQVESIENDKYFEKGEHIVEEDQVYSDDDAPDLDNCALPLTSIESKYWKIKYCSKRERRQKLKYLSKTPIYDLRQYSFIDSALLIFKQADCPNLLKKLSKVNEILELKQRDLMEEFVSRRYIWNNRISLMNSQLKDFYKTESQEKSDEKSKQNNDNQNNSLGPPKTSGSSRRNRHHGDSVRTEAEFLEILESLEREREKDPLVKAQYGAATIPDMIMNPVKKYSYYLDSNNLVLDKGKWALRIKTDPIDTFTEAEHEKFCEAFAMWPKKFGRISNFMGGLRTTEECVLHYYKTKKTTNFKNIVANRNKRTTRKAAAYRRKQKEQQHRSKNGTQTPESSATEQNTPLALTPMIDSEADLSSDAAMANATNGHKRKKSGVANNESKKRKVSGSASNIPSSQDINSSIDISKQQQQVIQQIQPQQQEQLPSPSGPGSAAVKINNANVTIPQVYSADQQQLHPGLVFSNQGLKTIQQAQIDASQVTSFDLQQQTQQTASEKKKPRRGRKKQINVNLNVDGTPKADSTDEKKSAKDRSHITSYWSVQESNMFPVLLEKFGTDWDLIARNIGTKSATMVRNYYQRGSSENSNWESIARAADLRKTEDSVKTETEKASTQIHQRQPSAPAAIYPQPQPQPQPQQSVMGTAPLVGGPPLGYFHNKSYSYTSPIAIQQASLHQQQQQQQPSQPPQLPPIYSLPHQSSVPIQSLTNPTVDIRRDSISSTSSSQHQRQSSLPGISTLNSTAPSYNSNSIYTVKPPVLPTPSTATHSTGMMKMSALLNSPADPPNLSHPQTHLPPLILGNNFNGQQNQAQPQQPTPTSSTPFMPKPRASIMSLLNNDNGADSNRSVPPVYPSIVHPPTTSTTSLPAPPPQQQQQQQRATYHASPLSQLMNPAPPLPQSQQQSGYFGQHQPQSQPPQSQPQHQQQQQQQQGTQGQPAHLSALDALAQVAFERK